MINTAKIKARAIELGLKQEYISNQLSIAQSTYNQKISNKRPMKLEEAEKLSIILKIDNSIFGDYFFYNPVA